MTCFFVGTVTWVLESSREVVRVLVSFFVYEIIGAFVGARFFSFLYDIIDDRMVRSFMIFGIGFADLLGLK